MYGTRRLEYTPWTIEDSMEAMGLLGELRREVGAPWNQWLSNVDRGFIMNAGDSLIASDGGSLKLQMSTTDYLSLIVSDSGRGVSKEMQHAVLRTAIISPKRDCPDLAGGKGLSLSESKSIVRRLGGEIGFYNNKGAVFWYNVPLESLQERVLDPLPGWGVSYL